MQEIRIPLERKRRLFTKDEYIELQDLLDLCKHDPCQAAGIVLRVKNQELKKLLTDLVFHYYNRKSRVQVEGDEFEDIVSVVTGFLL